MKTYRSKIWQKKRKKKKRERERERKYCFFINLSVLSSPGVDLSNMDIKLEKKVKIKD
jgi:hypothetical protein